MIASNDKSQTRVRASRGLLLVALILFVGTLASCYVQKMNRSRYLQFVSSRRSNLESLGAASRENANANGGAMPNLAVLSRMLDEASAPSQTDSGPVIVFRWIPSVNHDGSLVLAYEEYADRGYPDEGNVLRLDGQVLYERSIERALRKDDELRRSEGLAPIGDPM